MRRISLIAPLAVSVIALVPSCNLLFPFAPDQICESRIRALCHFAFSCCSAGERDLFGDLSNFRDEGHCIEELLAEAGSCGNAPEVQQAVQQGRFEYDGALAEQCEKPIIDALNACDADAVLGDELEQDEECLGVGVFAGSFAYGTGTVKDGDECFEAFECATPGSVCEPPEDPEDDGKVLITRVGTCKEPAKEGGDCSEDGSGGLCEEGTFCDFQTEKCVAIELSPNGATCFDDSECESGFCNDTDVAVDATCADLLADGAECFEDDDCQSELCELDDAEETFVCVPQDDVVVEACNGLQGDDTVFE